MSAIGKPERATQNRVIALFRDELSYRYLGDWSDRDGNSNIEEDLLTAYLSRNGYTPAQISSAVYKLRTEADNHSRTLYGNKQAAYSLLRYGVPVKIEAGKVTWFFSTVQFIFAGNDSEGLQYGTIGTEEKYFLKWKEDEAEERCSSL
jgi:type I site-specific restriction-modification system R (restriction) subunit